MDLLLSGVRFPENLSKITINDKSWILANICLVNVVFKERHWWLWLGHSLQWDSGFFQTELRESTASDTVTQLNNQLGIYTAWKIKNSQIFCHTTERPAFSLGIGDFVAVDHLGNFDINDTIIQKVNKFHSHVFFHFGLSWNKVELSEVDFSLPSVEFFNSEAGVGLMLDFEEDTENGVFVLKFTFPEKWHPEVEKYNRWLMK